MFCTNCGAKIESHERFCGGCGKPAINHPVTMQASTTTISSLSSVLSKSGFAILIALSAGILFVVMFVPMFDVWGGLFPKGADYTFFDVVRYLFEGTDFDMWVEIFAWSAFVPAVALLISSMAKGRVMAILSSASGGGLLLYNLFRFISQNDTSDVFHFGDCSICIGFWIALALFAVCFACSIMIKKPAASMGY